MDQSPPLAAVFDPDSFDIENSEDVIGFAKQLIDGSHPGIYGSVEQNGNPELRWMATQSFDEFPVFHTLTAPDSRKVEQIQLHPNVNWMFSNHDLSLTLNLISKARILTDTRTLKRVWKQIKDKSHAFFLIIMAKVLASWSWKQPWRRSNVPLRKTRCGSRCSPPS